MVDKSKKSQSFLHGTMILTISLLLVKIMGILFRIFVTGMIGPTGATYFTIAYETYNPLFALATAGLPIAISRMVSANVANGNYANVRRIKKISIPIFFFTGTIGFVLMLIGAFVVPNLPFIKVPGAMYSVLALSPTIFFACLMSVYRGYYQGLRNMNPTAISEVIEASCKFFIGYVFSYSAIHFGLSEWQNTGTFLGVRYATQELAESAIVPFASAGAILGISIGAFGGFLFLFLRDKFKGDGITIKEIKSSKPTGSMHSIARTLIMSALPIGLGAVIMNVAGLIDTTLLLHRIQNIMNIAPKELLNQYGSKISETILKSSDGVHGFLMGCYSFTLPLMMLIPAVTQAFGIAALPSVTEAWTMRDKKKLKFNMETVIKMTMLVTIPAGIGICILGPDILSVIYKNRPNAVSIASEIIPVLSIATIFTAASTPICSMLQAVGRIDLPVKIIPIGLIIKIVVNYILVGIPSVNIQGIGIGSLIGYIFVLIISIFMLCKETGIVPNFICCIFKPFLASIFCGLTAKISVELFKIKLPVIISVILSIFLAFIVYILTLLIFGGLRRRDIMLLPNGKSFVKVLEKLKIMR